MLHYQILSRIILINTYYLAVIIRYKLLIIHSTA
jgi:hypothetical protein